MFFADEHNERYLALRPGSDADRGMLTGAVGGTGGPVNNGRESTVYML